MEDNIEEYKAGWQRAAADYQNLQKEVARQRAEWMAMSEWQVISEFIPVYDNLKKAIGHKPEAGSHEVNWMKGIEFIMKQFGDVLKVHGVEEIKTVGEVFDATKHEVVSEEQKDGEVAHTIIREVDGGYMVKGKVVKVAKVVVAK